MQSLHQMPAQSVLGTGGGGAGAVNALVQISPWDARVPGLRDVILRATKEVIADLRVELGQSAVRGGPA
jgi:hypothetical protein